MKEIIACSIFTFLLDSILAHWFPNDKKGRYFALHAFTNALVVIVTTPDVYNVVVNTPQANMFAPTNYHGPILAMVLHAYHILMFRPLDTIDWVHHILSCFICAPLVTLMNKGPLLNFGIWFVTGFPGGIEYATLVLVRKGYMEKLTQKWISSILQVYVRCPGMIAYLVLLWTSWNMVSQDPDLRRRYASKAYVDLAYMDGMVAISCFIYYWNATYFMHRVVLNYGEKRYSSKLKN